MLYDLFVGKARGSPQQFLFDGIIFAMVIGTRALIIKTLFRVVFFISEFKLIIC